MYNFIILPNPNYSSNHLSEVSTDLWSKLARKLPWWSTNDWSAPRRTSSSHTSVLPYSDARMRAVLIQKDA